MTKTDVTTAIKQDVDLIAYIEQCGLHPVPHGTKGYYRTKEHDSLVISPPQEQGWRTFTWNSRNVGGSVIDFAMAHNGLSQKEAISHLRGFLNGKEQYVLNRNRKPETPRPVQEPKPFEPPAKSTTGYKRLFGYLVKNRQIDAKVVQHAVDNKTLYQDTNGNVCFLGHDYDGKPAYAALRTTASDILWRGEAAGSNKAVGYTMNIIRDNPPKEVFVTESPIDSMSIMTILNMNRWDYMRYGYIALGGTSENALMYHVLQNPQIQRVYLCQDNDDAGHQSRAVCRKALEKAGFMGQIIDKPPNAKDFNDDLKTLRAGQEVSQQQNPMIERGIEYVR